MERNDAIRVLRELIMYLEAKGTYTEYLDGLYSLLDEMEVSHD